MSDHKRIDLPVQFGTQAYFQAKCSCGWISGTAFRTKTFSDRAFEAHTENSV